MAEYDIGVCVFVLNEAKFLPYALRGYMASHAVETIVVVEGHVQGYPKDNVTANGLSTDGTAEAVRSLMKKENGGKIVFEQLGFVWDKRDLQNRGFEIIRAKLGEGAIYLLAGADEVYHPRELVTLQQEFKKRPKAKIIVYPFFHFWWRPDLIAIGSSWGVKMHRAYRRPGLPVLFHHHAAPPADCGRGPQFEVDTVHCYHYVGMQDLPHIHAKLNLYKARDGHRLKVTDTWTNWKWGDRTQWTHAGGSTKRFEGKHPYVIEKDVWKLTPKDADGKSLPLPEVPWDSDADTEVTVPPKKIGVFIEGGKVPADQQIVDLISYFVEHHNLEVHTIYGKLEDAQQHGIKTVKKFRNSELNRCDLVVIFPESFVFRPLGAPHIAVLWKEMPVTPDWGGYTVYETEASRLGKFQGLPRPGVLIKEWLSRLESKPFPTAPRTASAARRVPIVGPVRALAGAKPGPLAGTFHTVKIRNVTADVWKKGTFFVGAFWCDGVRGLPVNGGVQTKRDLPKDVRPGETLEVKVAVPNPPIQSGRVQLRIDVLDNVRGRWLNVGIQIPYLLRSGCVY